MDVSHSFFQLFSYDMWANEQVLFSLQNNFHFQDFDKASAYYAHIAGSQELWYTRITEKSAEITPAIWPDYDLATAHQVLNTSSEKWKALLKRRESHINHRISYQNSSGSSFETPLTDILHHVIIHGQHHRAQIAILLRRADIEPPQTDFIFFSRSN